MDTAKKRDNPIYGRMEANILPAVWQLPNQGGSKDQQTDPNESQGNPEKEKKRQSTSKLRSRGEGK